MASKRARSPSVPDDAPAAKRNDSGGLLHAQEAPGHTLSPVTESSAATAEEAAAREHQGYGPSHLQSEAVATPLLVQAEEFTAVHDSWETFEEALKAYAQHTFQLYVTRSTTSVKRRNLKITESAARGDAAGRKRAGLMEHHVGSVEHVVERTLIPEQLLWYSKSLKCTHGWKDRHRGTGKRGSGVVRSTSCPAKMCVTLQHRGPGLADWKVVVTKHVRIHNHQLSKELYLYYTENRRIYDPELLGVVGESTATVKPVANAHILPLIDQPSQRTGLYRMLTSSDEQSQQHPSSMAFMASDSPAPVSVPDGNVPDGHSSQQHVATSEASRSNFVIRPRPQTGIVIAAMPPMGAVVLTAGTVPCRAMDGGGFCVPRVAVKVHATWDAFHDYIAQYSFDTAQIFRTRSTVSVGARNAKLLASIAAKAGGDDHDVASYASYAAAAPASRLIPEEYKWFSKLLICTYGWKSRARGKRPRHGEHDASGPCPAMLLARMERNVDGQWHVMINRQVPEHNHRLNGQVDVSDQHSFEARDSPGALDAAPSLDSTPTQLTSSVDSSSLLETERSVDKRPAPSRNRREIVVRVPKLQSVFNSWDDFHASLKAYSDATYQLYRTRTTSSAQGRNKKITLMKRDSSDDENDENSDNASDPDATLNGVNTPRKIPESWRWYSKTLTCTHGWKERNRGTGKRSAHGVRSTACPVKICATLQYVNSSSRLEKGPGSAENSAEAFDSCWRVVVTKHIVDHNHNLSRELYQHYCENRRIYDPELLAIDSSNGGTVVKQNVYHAPPDEDTAADDMAMPSAELNGGQISSQPPVLSAQLEAGLAEAVSHAQFFGTSASSHPVGIATSGANTLQQTLGGVSVAVGDSQQVVPSVVLLPYSSAASYLPGQAHFQSQGQQLQTEHQQQTVTEYAGHTGAHLGRGSAGSEGVATLAAIAAPGLAPANVVLLNNAGMATTSALPSSGSNVISVACRVHGSSTGASLADSGQTPRSTTSGSHEKDPANGQAAQCTCFRIAGGGNYVTIVPASDPLGPADTSFDADDQTMLYAGDMEGVWHPSSNLEFEKVASENGEMIWRVPRIVRQYPTWEAFHKYLDAYSTATFQLYRVRTTYSVRSRNTRLRQLALNRGLTVREGDKDATAEAEQEGGHALSRAHLVPEQYEWYSKTFLCTHGWKRRSRGNGQRVSHNVRATECPAKVCATLQRTNGATNWSVVVTKHVTEHNHEISEVIYKQYSEVRRVRDPHVLAQAEQLWRGGGTRRRVFEFLKEQSPNHTILMKDVHNLVQRWQSQERRPRQNDQQDEEVDQEEQQQNSPLVVSAGHDEESAPWL